MMTKMIFIFSILISVLLAAVNADARYYSSVECQCCGGYASGGTIKLGMRLCEVVRVCGPPTRKYQPYVQSEIWVYSPSEKRSETAVYRHFLFKQGKWKKPKIFRFRNLKLYQIYDFGNT